MKKPLISIIIRSKNEEKWIKACLAAVFSQSIQDFEVILVDNHSTDATLRKAKLFPVHKVLSIDDYLPGKAINVGVDAAEGEFITLLSAHCVPTSSHWLENLYANFKADEKGEIAGVYGRQEPLSFTDDLDKRDLIITFGLDRRVQVKDSFFHNANSMVRRSVLDKIPFSSSVTNIEDRVWGREVIQAGYKLVYEPEASVYHHHGIHQSADRRRARNIVRIIESLEKGSASTFEKTFDLLQYKVAAVITARGNPEPFCGRTLVEYAIDSAKSSRLIGDIYVATDNEETRKLALSQGAKVPFLRPASLSGETVGVEEVLQYFITRLEELETAPDLILYLSTKHPFRRKGLLDWLIELQITRGFDSVMAGFPTFKSCWVQDGEGLKRIDEGFVARGKKQPVHLAYAGLGCVTHVDAVRRGKLLGNRVGILEVLDNYAITEVGSSADAGLAEKIFPDWWKQYHELSPSIESKPQFM